MVPLIFEPYALDLAARVAALQPTAVLEVAAGTGVVTREMARLLPLGTRIVATDLNPPMLEQAAASGLAAGIVRPIEWQPADALQLPFEDGSFDAVVCQFGTMFFADKARAFAEARRVLRPGGWLAFNVWDALAHNEFADTITAALAEALPAQPPRFMARVPHGYHDLATIRADLQAGGFSKAAHIVTLPARSRASSARRAALAYCQGTPLRGEIEAQAPGRLEEVTAFVATALARRFGAGPVDGLIQAHVITVAHS
jgi:ubiquinone/menaquinone biosynthesis C-methylase UbiE